MVNRVESVQDVLEIIDRGRERLMSFHSDEWLAERPFPEEISEEEYVEYARFAVAVYNAALDARDSLKTYANGGAEAVYDSFVDDAYVSDEMSEDFPPLQIADSIADALGLLMALDDEIGKSVVSIVQILDRALNELKNEDPEDYLREAELSPYDYSGRRRSRRDMEAEDELYIQVYKETMQLLEGMLKDFQQGDMDAADESEYLEYVVQESEWMLRTYKNDILKDFPAMEVLRGLVEQYKV